MAANYVVLDGAGNEFEKSSTDIGSGVQADNVRICDATAANFMPIMDTVGHKGFVAITDGTDTAGIDDVDGALDERADVYQQVAAALMATDPAGSAGAKIVPVALESTAAPNLRVARYAGANQAPSMDAAARAGYQVITDLTNVMPTMDAVARKGFVAVTDGTDTALITPASDSFANPTALEAIEFPMQFNGTTWDRERGNVDATILASAARTASVDSSDQTNYNGRGLHVTINVTAVTDTPSLVFTIQGKDPVSGAYYTLLASAAIVGTGTTVLRVFPGATAAGNLVANDSLPRVWRVSIVNNDTDSITYSVGASVLL